MKHSLLWTFFNRILMLFTIILLTSCYESPKAQNKKTAKSTSLNIKKSTKSSEIFSEFYQKFTTDSIFQISRIRFPLSGYSNEKRLKEATYLTNKRLLDDSLTVNVEWKKNFWIMHHAITDSSYKTIRTIKDSTVIERTYLPNSEYDFRSYYKRINGLWYLIYYYDSE